MGEEIKRQLEYVRESLRNKSINKKFSQEQIKRKNLIENLGNDRWNSKIDKENSTRIIKWTCLVCGYAFGEESLNYENGCHMYHFILNLVIEQKNIHDEICRSGLIS